MTKHVVDVASLEGFDDIEDRELRNKNRGAVMANLLEDYYLSLLTESNSFKDYLVTSDAYLSRFDRIEHQEIKQAMISHLEKRGYTFGS